MPLAKLDKDCTHWFAISLPEQPRHEGKEGLLATVQSTESKGLIVNGRISQFSNLSPYGEFGEGSEKYCVVFPLGFRKPVHAFSSLSQVSSGFAHSFWGYSCPGRGIFGIMAAYAAASMCLSEFGRGG